MKHQPWAATVMEVQTTGTASWPVHCTARRHGELHPAHGFARAPGEARYAPLGRHEGQAKSLFCFNPGTPCFPQHGPRETRGPEESLLAGGCWTRCIDCPPLLKRRFYTQLAVLHQRASTLRRFEKDRVPPHIRTEIRPIVLDAATKPPAARCLLVDRGPVFACWQRDGDTSQLLIQPCLRSVGTERCALVQWRCSQRAPGPGRPPHTNILFPHQISFASDRRETMVAAPLSCFYYVCSTTPPCSTVRSTTYTAPSRQPSFGKRKLQASRRA